jgi:redox-sensitive bicupin YhaK (pirin superfamily)
LLISTQPGISYSEHNLSKDKTLTRMQLWLDACPERENPLVQKLDLTGDKQQLIASLMAAKAACSCVSSVAASYRTEER